MFTKRFEFVGDRIGPLLVAASAKVSRGDLMDGCTKGVVVSTAGGRVDFGLA